MEGDKIAQEIRSKGNDLLVSIGGGRVLDLGKYAATRAGINYISIPTSPSNDGITSSRSVLKTPDGFTESIQVNMPIGILVDSNMLVTAPLPNIRAGVGDLISNLSAIEDWKIAYEDGKDSMDDFAASLAISAAQLIFETCRAGSVDLQSTDFLEKLVHGLILSGIAMHIAGNSRPASGAEHEISHAIDLLYPGSSMHGLQVAYGTMLASYMRGEELDELIRFFKTLQLPMHHSELGLTEEQMIAVILKAPETRSERYTIIEKLRLNERKARKLLTQYNEHISNSTGK